MLSLSGTPRRCLLLITLALGFSASAHAQFKCVDKQGKTIFQQMPCDKGDQSEALKLQSGGGNSAPSTATQPARKTQLGGEPAPVPAAGGRTFRGEPCPTAAEMADLDRKIERMKVKQPAPAGTPEVPDGLREMMLQAAEKTRRDIKQACG